MVLQRRTRSFRSSMLRALAPRVLAFLAVAVVIVVGRAHGQAPSEMVFEQATRAPSWSVADAMTFPECVASTHWVTGTPAPAVVVQGVATPGHRKLGFDRAWALNHNDTRTDDVWVLGVCP